MKIKIVIAIIAVLFIATNVAHAALKPTFHNGLYLGFGLGGGTAAIQLDDYDLQSDREGGTYLNLRVGGSLKQNLLLGLEVDAWRKEENGFALQFNNYTMAVTYYPNDIFFLKGGPGVAVVVAEAFGYTDSQSGFGLTLGTGAELRVTQKFALVPSLTYVYQDLDGFDANFVSFGLGFNWFL